LRTLRLYETGVGYFERSGSLGAADPTSLPLPAGHLDDALKTLVVLGADGKSTVHGIEFGSSVGRGMARALAGLPVDGDEPLGLQQILVGLKGAAVEVRTRAGGGGGGSTWVGRIIDVVESTDDGVVAHGRAATEAQGDTPKARERPSALTVLVLTDAGGIARVPGAQIESVRPLDPTYGRRLGSALDALSTRSAQTERRLRVLATGGPVTLGYVAETPVWRTTYRLVLDDRGATGLLQGWALLHNDTDEDWQGVRVQLASGRPDSFLFPLAAPRYAQRPLVTPPDSLATLPQLMNTTVDAIWGDNLADANGASGLGLGGTGEGGGGRGEGIGLGSIGSMGYGGRAGRGFDAAEVPASTPSTEGVEAGALFVYRLPEPVSLRAHGSALVPFAEQRIDARQMTWFDGPSAPARSAVRFVNATAQTLPAGTIALFADGGFAGESMLPRLKPGERRFLSYGLDLDVDLRVVDTRSVEELRRLVWNPASRALREEYSRTSDVVLAIENRGGQPRIVALASTYAVGTTITGPDQVQVDTATLRPVAIYAASARSRAERKLQAVEALARATPFAALTAARLAELSAAPTLAAADRAAATEGAARLREAEDDAKSLAKTNAGIAELEKDLERMRENIKAAAGERPAGGAPANPFVARVLAGEDRLAALRRRRETLEADAQGKNDAAQSALGRLVR
jgi:hypothetical protein